MQQEACAAEHAAEQDESEAESLNHVIERMNMSVCSYVESANEFLRHEIGEAEAFVQLVAWAMQAHLTCKGYT